jgi:hypothetical protein
MKIEAGKYYRMRRGLIVGPLTRVSWCDRTFAASDITWKENGSYVQGITHSLDLISEVYVSDTPPAVQKTEDKWRARLLAAGPGPFIEVHERKTLRDEFVMQLMDADDFMVGFKEHAEQLYRVADALMEARKK